MTMRSSWRLWAAGLVLAGCSQTEAAAPAVPPLAAADLQLIDRLTWGVNATEIERFRRLGREGWIEHQFREPAAPLNLPAPVQARLDAMEVATVPMERLATAAEALRYAGTHGTDKPARAASYTRFATESRALQREAVERSLLRDLYSPDQMREQLTWFWFNHFNVRIAQQPLATMVRDYEELTIRPRALGKFCDLVGATLRHPAMLIYLNNTANRADRINENYARELMELHTMGVGSGYTQADVKALARVLTGARADLETWPIPGAAAEGARRGIFVFDPSRHDNGAKTLLGKRLTARGEAEIDEATGMLCRHPATARRISSRLAQFFVADAPPPALVEAMAATFKASDGDIAAVLRTMIARPEFAGSLGTLYKDPNHYLLSAVRLAYDDRVIVRPAALNAMLATLGQARFARLTPDGYPLEAAEWSSSGQLATRFGLASAIGRGAVRLFTPEGAAPERGVPPDLQALVKATGIDAPFAPETAAALAAAKTPGEWNSLYLASPEFMRR